MVGDLSRSLACCGLGTVPLPAGGDGLGRLVVRHREGRAALAGVTRCASPWACPVCAPKLAQLRAEAMRPQVAHRMAAGFSAWLLTLTVRHTRAASLPELFAVTGQAWARATSGREWDAVRKAGAPEFVRGFDYTRTEANGHHLHLHVLLLLPPAHGDGEALAGWFLGRWIDKVRAAGGDALPGAQDATRTDNPEQAARYAVTPAACYEAVALAKKRARSGAEGGETPFEILGRAVAGDRRAVTWWREYTAATKGKRQVTTSRGLKLAGDEELVEETEAEEARTPDLDALAAFTPRALREADRAGLLPRLLDAAEAGAGDPDGARVAVAALLAELPAGEWWLLPPCGPPPPDLGHTFRRS